MTNTNKEQNSIIPISSTALVRVGNSVDVTNKIIREYDGRLAKKILNTAKIGAQKWTTENLDVECYSNGDPISQVTDPEEWDKLESGAWCYFKNEVGNKHLGKLYNWYAVNDKRGLASKGFHIPSDKEWIKLTQYLGAGYLGSKMMKNTNGWEKGDDSSNECLFEGLPCGLRNSDGSYSKLNEFHVNWWSSTDTWGFHLGYHYTLEQWDKNIGLSVRCIKDK